MVGGLIHTCTIQRRYPKQRLAFDGGTGTFTAGLTVTGESSGATGVISSVGGTVGSGYLVLQTIVGAFVDDETITDTGVGAATVNGAAIDYQNQSGEPGWYWSDDQTDIPCRFYYGGGRGRYRHEVGDVVDLPPKCILPATVSIASAGYRIVTTAPGFAGTYEIGKLIPRSNSVGLDHYEVKLAGGI